ncbi:MAG: GntR family transcriptional regulator [Victivallales bacterium]|nr:GntR family transcriptional regulator [Victivallales bacterium]
MSFSKQKELYDEIVTQIRLGALPVGTHLPTGRVLASQKNVCHNTVRYVYNRLEKEGYIEMRPGFGTMVKCQRPFFPESFRILIVNKTNINPRSTNFRLLKALTEHFRMRNWEYDEIQAEFLGLGDGNSMTEMLSQRHYSGIIVMAYCTEAEFKPLHKLGLPISVYDDDEFDKYAEVHSFVFNATTAFEESIKYLRQMGHRRIAIINGNNQDIRGYNVDTLPAFLKSIDVEPDINLVAFSASQQVHDVAKSVEKILAIKRRPTAFYCYTDSIAVGVYAALGIHNYVIPRDYSVMSFGNDPGNELLQPALSTAQFHFNEMAEAILDNLVKPAARKRTEIASSFYFRDSVATMRKSK